MRKYLNTYKKFFLLQLFGLMPLCFFGQGAFKGKVELKASDFTTTHDSAFYSRKERLEMIREKDQKVEQKVVVEINKKRFSTLARKWWGLPTEVAQKKIDKGRYERFFPLLGMEELYKQPGKIYRNRNEILNEQNVIVHGTHPSWAAEAFRSYNFKLLTHLSFYAYELNPFTGGYQNFESVYNFKNSELIKMAHADSCKVILTLACHHPECAEIFFTSEPKVQRNLIDSLKSILNQAQGDGIEINFEELPIEYKDAFEKFVRELSFQLRENNPNTTVALSLPLSDEKNIYDLGFLQNWVDFFIISGYNFHLKPTGVSKIPLAPLFKNDAAYRGTMLSYEQFSNLDSVLHSPGTIRLIELMHNEDYTNRLRDSLNFYIKKSKIENIEYNPYDLGDVLRVVQLYNLILDNPFVRQLLKRTACKVALAKYYEPQKKVHFYLFEPEWDTVPVFELDLFNGMGGVISNQDSLAEDLIHAFKKYRNKMGKKNQSSLVMGLPNYGSVWSLRDGRGFEGYLSYAQIRNLIRGGQATVTYNKKIQSLIAIVSDSLGPVQEIFFDNSTTLAVKIKRILDEQMGGISIWALSYDHGYTELWNTIENQVASRKMYDEDSGSEKIFKIKKSNKIHYTIAYQLKRYGKLIFSSIFCITLLLTIAFVYSLFDWRVRDIMFYSGAFRIFYLLIFTLFILMLGSWMGLFENMFASLLVGLILGALLTWLSTMILAKSREKLP